MIVIHAEPEDQMGAVGTKILDVVEQGSDKAPVDIRAIGVTAIGFG